MPQKTVFVKPPLLTLQQAFPSSGLVRTGEKDVARLYQDALLYSDNPACWEGLFRLACLVTDRPEESPVYPRIMGLLADTDSGSFEGDAAEQIAKARACFALFEFNADRSILRRLGNWLRYLEIEWNELLGYGKPVFAPADLMELLVRFYRISGMKAVLRLCTRLRTSAFDWTTALHTIQQTIPLRLEGNDPLAEIFLKGKEDIEYDEKQILLNHAEMLADGIRYAHFSGEFSGNGQDLSAGRFAWSFLSRHHRALCGGTTGNPYLAGTSASANVDTRVLSAWIEAFACSMALTDTLWATDELVRIVFNGLGACLRAERLPAFQRVNCIHPETTPAADAGTYARFMRAVAAVYSHAVGVTENGVRINYMIPCRVAVMVNGCETVVTSDGRKASFRLPSGASIQAELFSASTETAVPLFTQGNESIRMQCSSGRGGLIPVPGPVGNGSGISDWQDQEILTEHAHHQGVACWLHNRLLCLPVREGEYAWAMEGNPELRGGVPEARIRKVNMWKQHGGEPDDIPVLPSCSDETTTATMTAYDRTSMRIALLPRPYST